MKRESVILLSENGRLYWAEHFFGRGIYSINVFRSDGVNARLMGIWTIKK